MSHELADITTCRICGQIFSGPRIAIIGQQNGRFENFMQGLGKHLTEKHPEQSKLMMKHGGAFMEMLCLMHFQTDDPELVDFLRWQVHQQTLNATIPDEKLEAQCETLACKLVQEAFQKMIEHIHSTVDDPAALERGDILAVLIQQNFRDILLEVFTGIRDLLQEPGKYPVPSDVKKGGEA